MNTFSRFLAILLWCCISCLHAAEKTDSKPNIILIMADDLGYGSLGCYGNHAVKTPNIDRLATNGVRLTDYHSNGPMCSPTRAAMLTGRYQQRCAWVADEDLSPIFRTQRSENLKQRWAWGIPTAEVTLPSLLKQAGYRTALIGKWHLGYDRKFHPLNYGFDEFRGFIGGAVDYHTHVATHGKQELDWWNNQLVENESGYTTDLLTNHAVKFIERNKQSPFFIYLTHAAVHTPLQSRAPQTRKPAAAIYQEMIQTLDESVGGIVAALEQHQLDKNTLVIFCSDNGPQAPRDFAANGPLKGDKGSLFEGGLRVPCIAAWPGVIKAGQIRHEPAMSMDLFPTIAQVAGAVTPKDRKIDGVDLLPNWNGEAKLPERTVYWKFGDNWAVRNGNWKLIGSGKTPQSLINLADDVSEQNNLLKSEQILAQQLFESYKQWVADVGDR